MGILKMFKRNKENKQNKVKQEKKRGVLTLYSVTLDSKNIFDVIKEEFSEVTKSIQTIDGGLKIIFKDGTDIEFNLSDDINHVTTQTNGMANFFSKSPIENEKILQQAMLQISMFTCIVGIGFELNDDEKRTNYIVNTIYEIANKTQSFILYPSMKLYTSEGKLLISIDGETDFEKYYPISNSDLLKRDIKPSCNDEERYRKIIKECDEKKIPHTDFMLSTQIMENEVKVTSVEKIAKRATAVFSCALYSECLLIEGGSIELAKDEFEDINKIYGVKSYLTDKEKEYIQMEQPDKITAIQFSWQYERCCVLLWALGLIDLNSPTEICNVHQIAQIIRNYDSIDELIKDSSIRSNEELLDMHTRILYYDWACVESRVENQETPANLNSGVVQEQHFALNWIISANEDCEWDDISPNT
ncbi:DUF4272 domain-containing protein [Tepidibacter hydrothermalis]|uniref:DUF4272 domain-containing protein n=1 Tax=Tepidibacter hydrothermalis TaxID=3036126 RepID=A0ABY8EFQ6_9FIRM|nr:DUF4272 domain-containing protein [Tepidibacter hydrothermalis]WFD11781.1 DUF4272 domain-containing protein [Tepidibacter hydrothermalis]